MDEVIVELPENPSAVELREGAEKAKKYGDRLETNVRYWRVLEKALIQRAEELERE